MGVGEPVHRRQGLELAVHHPVKALGGMHPAGFRIGAIGRDIDVHHPGFRRPFDLARIGHTVAVGIEPQRQRFQFVTRDCAVVVFVEGCQRLIAMLPVFAKGVVAEQLFGIRHHPLAFRIPDEQRRFGRGPPFVLLTLGFGGVEDKFCESIRLFDLVIH